MEKKEKKYRTQQSVLWRPHGSRVTWELSRRETQTRAGNLHKSHHPIEGNAENRAETWRIRTLATIRNVIQEFIKYRGFEFSVLEWYH